jgi:AraC family transcriptional regulator, transcriptional activator FtrA
MSRRFRWALYTVALVVPPVVAGALGLRELETRARPALLPRLPAESTALVAPPPYDPVKPTVAVLLGADVTENIDALGPYEMFARAGKFNVYTVAPERRPTLLSGGLRILPHFSLAELDARLAGRPPAVVIVPNIPNIARAENRPLVAWMQRQAAAGALMHSWCTGAMALAEAGLLDGRTATAHWGDLARLAERYPRVQWVRDVRWVDHGTLITSGGLTSGIDASLRVLRRLAGDSVARRVARELRYPNYHYSIDPAVQPYTVSPADAVLLANAAFRVARSQIGLALYDGVGEIELSALYETHAYTAVADVHTVATAPGVVRTAHGLTLLPSLAPASAADRAAAGVRELDQLIVPGRDARVQGARVVATVAALAPALEPAYPQADAPERFALEPVLEELARSVDLPTARFAVRRLEYRATTGRPPCASRAARSRGTSCRCPSRWGRPAWCSPSPSCAVSPANVLASLLLVTAGHAECRRPRPPPPRPPCSSGWRRLRRSTRSLPPPEFASTSSPPTVRRRRGSRRSRRSRDSVATARSP